AATLANANSITFINQDDTTREVIFTPSAGYQAIDTITIEGNKQVKVDIPISWVGNAYAVTEGAAKIPGMLAEVTFQGWNDFTYFDVSAIVNPTDTNGVKQIFPASELESTVKNLVSGCISFPCTTAYYAPADIQTVTTKETDLIVTLGNSPDVVSREVE
ncbi:DNase1 protein, partial [Hypoxylon sp. EC38]